MNDIKNIIRPTLTILGILVMVFNISCGGGGKKKEPPPPYDPTDDQMAALMKFHSAAEAYKNALANDPKNGKGDKAHRDALMNTLLMYMTADNGKSANKPGAMEYLVWYIKNYMMKEVQAFASRPPADQAAILGRLGAAYNFLNSSGLSPQLTALVDPLVSPYLGGTTSPLNSLPTTSTAGPFKPSASFSFNETATNQNATQPFSSELVNLNAPPLSFK